MKLTQRETMRQKQRDRDTRRQRNSETETQGYRETARQRHQETEKQRDRDTTQRQKLSDIVQHRNQGLHTVDRLEERGVERGRGRQSTTRQGRYLSIRPTWELVQRQHGGDLRGKGRSAIWGFPSA